MGESVKFELEFDKNIMSGFLNCGMSSNEQNIYGCKRQEKKSTNRIQKREKKQCFLKPIECIVRNRISLFEIQLDTITLNRIL